MHFQTNEIKIHTIKMAKNWSSKIMWVEVGENTVQRLINRSITLKNPNIQLITYYPAQLWNKRKEWNEIMKEARKTNPELRYQINVGKKDLELKTKHTGEVMYQTTSINEFVKSRPNIVLEDVPSQSPILKRGPKRNRTPEKESAVKKQKEQETASLDQ